jgi:hypothetical protein
MTSALLTLIAAAALAQGPAPDRSNWGPLVHLPGTWDGKESGSVGEGTGVRTCDLVLGGHFLFCRNTSTFPPQERNPEGEVHEDWLMINYDATRGRMVARQFNVETYVNEFEADSAQGGPNKIVFVSERSDNAPEGTRITYRYEFDGPDVFREEFVVAFPGADEDIVITNEWTRRSAPPSP